MKYFIEDSAERAFFLSRNRGMTERRLISSPIHILNQEYDEMAIKVPKIIEFRKIIL